jgi:hypothetical protein
MWKKLHQPQLIINTKPPKRQPLSGKTMNSKEPNKNTPPNDFDNLLIEAIDETLSTLGTFSKTAIYAHLKKKYNIEKHELPKKIKEFSIALDTLFSLGARQLETMVMKNLQTKTREKKDRKNITLIASSAVFQEFVATEKEVFEGKLKNR